MFSQYLWHTTNGLHKKFPIKTCGMSDDLSGDMLAPSWPNQVTHLLKMSKCELSLKVLQIANFSQITHSPTFGRAFTW